MAQADKDNFVRKPSVNETPSVAELARETLAPLEAAENRVKQAEQEARDFTIGVQEEIQLVEQRYDVPLSADEKTQAEQLKVQAEAEERQLRGLLFETRYGAMSDRELKAAVVRLSAEADAEMKAHPERLKPYQKALKTGVLPKGLPEEDLEVNFASREIQKRMAAGTWMRESATVTPSKVEGPVITATPKMTEEMPDLTEHAVLEEAGEDVDLSELEHDTKPTPIKLAPLTPQGQINTAGVPKALTDLEQFEAQTTVTDEPPTMEDEVNEFGEDPALADTAIAKKGSEDHTSATGPSTIVQENEFATAPKTEADAVVPPPAPTSTRIKPIVVPTPVIPTPLSPALMPNMNMPPAPSPMPAEPKENVIPRDSVDQFLGLFEKPRYLPAMKKEFEQMGLSEAKEELNLLKFQLPRLRNGILSDELARTLHINDVEKIKSLGEEDFNRFADRLGDVISMLVMDVEPIVAERLAQQATEQEAVKPELEGARKLRKADLNGRIARVAKRLESPDEVKRSFREIRAKEGTEFLNGFQKRLEALQSPDASISGQALAQEMSGLLGIEDGNYLEPLEVEDVEDATAKIAAYLKGAAKLADEVTAEFKR